MSLANLLTLEVHQLTNKKQLSPGLSALAEAVTYVTG